MQQVSGDFHVGFGSFLSGQIRLKHGDVYGTRTDFS